MENQTTPLKIDLPKPAKGLNSFPAPEAPAKCLERPQALKTWSGGLLDIVEKGRAELFDSHDFKTGPLSKADLNRITEKMRVCGSIVELRAGLDRDTGEMTPPALHGANFCGQHTICPFCASRVQDRRKARFTEAIRGASRAYSYIYLVTATIPPVETWREDLNILLDSWRGFRKMGQKRKGRKHDRDRGEWGKIKAGLSKVEIKRGAGSGLPHCHIHGLFFTDKPFDFRVWSPEEKAKPREARASLLNNNGSKLSEEWSRATNGRATGLNVKRITGRACRRYKGENEKDYNQRAESWTFADSVLDQSKEVLKYATKFDTAPEAGTEAERLFAKDFAGIRSATYARRLFSTYGQFREVGGDDFHGSEYPISSRPVLYSVRWNTNQYSPLREISRSLFPNMEPSLSGQYRRVILGRVAGANRQVRTAINKAKKEFFEFGNLGPALILEKKWLDDGSFLEHEKLLELPGALALDPQNIELWEGWIDTAMEAGRARYNEARTTLDLESNERIIGTLAERQAQDNLERLILFQSETFKQDGIDLFIETLSSS